MKRPITLEKDGTWGAFDIHTWESFQEKIVPSMELIPQVNEQVRKRFEIIRKLIAHSFFEYQFCDIAAAHMHMLMEMAMAWKFEEVTGQPWYIKTTKESTKEKKKLANSRKLSTLFKWLKDNNYLDIIHPVDPDILRETRNYYAHPRMHTIGGGVLLSRIKELIAFINELYDPNLTLRNSLAIDLKNWLVANEKAKPVLCVGDKTIPLSDLTTAFIDCSSEKPVYYLALFPLFDLEPIRSPDAPDPQVLALLALIDVKIEDQAILGVDPQTKARIRIESSDPVISDVINKWHQQLGTIGHAVAQMPFWRNASMVPVVNQLMSDYFERLASHQTREDDPE
jgi:hypothetical protein